MNNNENYNDINISEDEMPVEQDPMNMDEVQEQENMDEVQEQKTGRDTAELVSVLVKDHKKLLLCELLLGTIYQLNIQSLHRLLSMMKEVLYS